MSCSKMMPFDVNTMRCDALWQSRSTMLSDYSSLGFWHGATKWASVCEVAAGIAAFEGVSRRHSSGNDHPMIWDV